MAKSNYSVTKYGDIYSYDTCLVTLWEGATVGNITYYSQTTSRHQSKAGVWACNILVDNVPYGASAAELAEMARQRQRSNQLIADMVDEIVQSLDP